MRFKDVTWRGEIDGIWACASLLHVPAADFPGVAARLASALRPRAAWYTSFKLGKGKRIIGGRTFVDHTEETLRTALIGTGAMLAEAWITGDVRTGRAGELWLNAVALRSS